MKLIALTLAALTLATTSAEAARPRIAPTPDAAPTCFSREYTPEHLRRNPGQKLEAMYVKLSRETQKDENGSWDWMPVQVVGVSRGEYYGNTAGCFIQKNGSVECSIDCDGGSFSLSHSRRQRGAVNFTVTKDYYFPLFKNRMSYDENEEGSLSLQDQANRIYQLVPADPRQCEEAIHRTLGQGEGGC